MPRCIALYLVSILNLVLLVSSAHAGFLDLCHAGDRDTLLVVDRHPGEWDAKDKCQASYDSIMTQKFLDMDCGPIGWDCDQDRKIKSLDWISEFDHLESVVLDGNLIRNLEPLRPLTHLISITLDGNPVQDYDALTNLRALEELDLCKTGDQLNNETLDKLIDALPHLENLYLGNLPISDISPIAKLKHLRDIYITGTNVRDVSPLFGNSKWELLGLGGLGVKNLDGFNFGYMPRLEGLDLSGNGIQRINELDVGRFPYLSSLSLEDNQIEDLTPFQDVYYLKDLTFLSLDRNQITDITPLTLLNPGGVLFVTLEGNPISYAECMEQVQRVDGNTFLCSSLLEQVRQSKPHMTAKQLRRFKHLHRHHK